ncbi:SCO4225 family membrane protein [Streptomyces sp. 5K101]|uniref:SCO4225 family membrane protein n=1 Tax=Streptomyces sp. 5K101 TaxID=3390037 RepID=UPI003975AFFD
MPFRPLQRLKEAAARYRRGTGALAISGGYAVIVLAVATFVIIASALQPGSFAAMWLFLVTLPSSLLLGFIPAQGTAYVLLLTLGGLVQAWLLWLVLRSKRVR